jgi:hypothetical protein
MHYNLTSSLVKSVQNWYSKIYLGSQVLATSGCSKETAIQKWQRDTLIDLQLAREERLTRRVVTEPRRALRALWGWLRLHLQKCKGN